MKTASGSTTVRQIDLSVDAGCSIDTAKADAAALALEYGVPVLFRHNDRLHAARPREILAAVTHQTPEDAPE